MSSSTRNCNGSNSSSRNSSSSNHMPAQRGNASRRISESSSSLGTTTSTTTSTSSSSSSSSVKHVVADKSAVKRKKRRKDEDDGEDEEASAAAAIITERVPVVLLTRLEDEKKVKESRVTSIHVSDVKVVIERTEIIESIRAASNDRSVLSVGKKNSCHSVHRSSENIASNNAKPLETISEKEERLKSSSRKGDDKKVVEEKVKAPVKKEEKVVQVRIEALVEKVKAPTKKEVKALSKKKEETVEAPAKKEEDKIVVEKRIEAPSKKEEEKAKAPTKKEKKVVEEKVEAPLKKEEVKAKAPAKKEKKVVEEKLEAPSNKQEEKAAKVSTKKEKKVVEEKLQAPSKKEEEKAKAPTKKEKKVVEEKLEAPSKKEEEKAKALTKKEKVEALSKKEKKVVEDKVEAPAKKQKKVVEEKVEASSKKDEEKVKVPAKKEKDKKVVEERIKSPTRKEEEKVKAPAKKEEKKVEEEKAKAPTKKEEKKVVEEKVKAPSKKKEEKKILEEKTKPPSKKEEEKKTVEEEVKAPPKKSIESTKNSDQTESKKSSKVKGDQKKPLDDLAERNVHNVNNDNLKTIDPKISERQLSVRLDRSQVESYLEKQRLQRLQQLTEDKSIAETDNYHSGSETQEDNVLSKEIKTCAIPSDNAAVAEKVQNDSLEKVQNDSLEKVQNDSLEKVQTDSLENVQNDSVEKVQNGSLEKASVDEKEVTDKVEEAVEENVEKPAEIKVKKGRGRPRKNKEETEESVVKNQRLPSKEKKKRAAKSKDVAVDENNKQDSDKDLGVDAKSSEDSSVHVSENQIEHLDESPKDTSCEFAKSDKVLSCPSSESLNESAVVVHSEQESSKVFETDRLDDKIVESNSSSDNAISKDDSSTVPEVEEPAQLPMEVDAIPQDCTGVDDSKAEDDSAQQICDIHSKSAEEVAETVAESTEVTVSKSTEATVSESTEATVSDSTEATLLENTEATLLESTEATVSGTTEATVAETVETAPLESTEPLVKNSVDSVSSESPIENLISSDSTVECPAKTTTEESETSELLSENLLASETSESVVNETSESAVANETSVVNSEIVSSPTDSFVSCENADESAHEGSISGEVNDSLIETIEEDTESTASTCTLIEEAPEELSQDLDKDLDDVQDELPEDEETLPQVVERLSEEVDTLPEHVERISEAVDSQPEQIERISEVVESQPEHVERISEVVESQPEQVERISEVVETQPEVDDDEVHKQIESIKELPQVAEKEEESEISEDSSLKPDDESFGDKTLECAELQESTFENNLKSVENLVIDSILNGEIVSPKITLQSAASRVEDQSFVFESGVEDFVNDIVAKDAPVSLEPTTPVDEIPTSLENNFIPSTAEASQVVAETLQSAVPIVEPPSSEATLHLESLPSVVEALAIEEASKSLAVVEQTLESLSPIVTEEEAATTTKDTSELSTPNEEPIDEEFAKHRRKQTLLELKKKCTENLDKRNAQASHENHQQQSLPQAISVDEMTHSDDSDLQVPSSVLSSDLYNPESTAIGTENFFENISDAESEICLAERLSRITGLDIPSLDEEPLSSLADKSEDEESTPERTKRQRILMKITKTDANKHVTHLVDEEPKNDLSMLQESEQQLIAAAAEQVTEGEIKIIMRKESSSNNHVIKEIKIIPRTPEGNNSARIPGYSPTSSDLSSGNSSCRVPSCSPAKPDSGSYRMPGWSPASTEIGQSTTIKKKQGRPKKYPIFTDAELIAKTTAIVNNGDVHSANKLTADKPLFEPVESIRINEDDEVEDHEEDEEHQTMITEQTCLSGSQLLEAMPTQPEIMAKLTQQIEEGQELAKKKRKGGRPRKHPRPGDIIDEGTKPIVNENVTVARIEYNVVDSIEEFVEPNKQMPSVLPVSPVKKRGRPRKVLTQESTVEESDSVVEDTTEEKKLRTSRRLSQDGDISSMTEDNAVVAPPKIERRGRKPWKHLKNLDKSAENQTIDGADSQTEDETVEDATVTKKVERRGRKPSKHLKNLESLSADSADSQTEDETTVGDEAVAKPKVERRGRKPWKHLKNLESQSADGGDSQTEDETVGDDAVSKPKVEKKSRKKHLKQQPSENQTTGDVDSQTEDETMDDSSAPAPRVERRGRKPRKHSKHIDKTVESPAAEDADSQTEDETVDDASAPVERVERRGRKAWKHLKNVDRSAESPAPTEDADSQTEDETVDDSSAPPERVERRGRKPWKHLKNVDMTAENQVTETAESQTEDETTVGDESTSAPRVERRGRKPRKHLKNIEKSAEDQTAESMDSQTEDETVGDAAVTKPKIERRGRKPWKHLKNIEKPAENAEGADSQTEDETSPVDDASAPALENVIKPSESEVPETADSQTEDETVDNAAVTKKVERRGRKPWKHLKNINQEPSENQTTEGVDSQTEDETADDASTPAPRVERRGRKTWKHLKKDESQTTENADSQTEDEATVGDESTPAPRMERRGRKAWKHLKKVENQVVDGADSQTEDETVDDAAVTKKVERRGRKPWKHLKNVEKPSENQAAEDASSKTVDETVDNTLETEENQSQLENSMTEGESADDTIEAGETTNAEEANSMTENESADDSLAPEPKVERRGRKSWKHLKNLDKSTDSQVTADSQTEDETVDEAAAVTKKVENRGRKPWKHLKNNSQSLENQVSQEQDSMTEGIITNDDSVSKFKVKKKVGRPLKKKKSKNILKMILPHEKRKRGRPRLEDTVEVSQLAQTSVFKKTSALLENSLVGVPKDIPEVESESKESSSDVTTPSEETTSNTENDTPAVEEVIKKKRGRKSLKNLQATSTFEDNISAAAEMNSMTEDESSNDTIATGDEATSVVEKKKKGRPRKVPQDNSIVPEEVSSVTENNTANDTIPTQNESTPVESAVVAEEVAKSPVTEDETVSSTEDIPTKNPSPMKSQVAEESSSLTEDETVSSTEDIPTSDPQQQQQQPVVKRGRPKKIVQTDSSTTPSASSVEESTTTMEPPVVVKRRGRQPFKKPQQADSTLPDNNTSAYTTEDETVSSTEDIPTSGEQQPVVKRGRTRKNVPEVEMNDSLAASSVEDLSAVEASPKKKRGRQPKVQPVEDSETAMPTEGETSIAASSMEDLSFAALPAVLKKKKGRKPKVQFQDDSTCSESMEEIVRLPVHQKKRGRPLKYPRIPIHLVKSVDVSADSIEGFSPVKQLSPMKKQDGVTPKVLEQVAATLYQDTFATEQPTYDKSATSLSPVKRRGRPPKFPRKEIVTDDSSAAEQQQQQQPEILEKRKARLPRRLSQEENILPSHIENRPGRSPRRVSFEEEDAPVLGKRQGRPPRKFSPDEEHSFSAANQSESDSPTGVGKKLGRSPKKFSPDEGVPAVSDSDELSSGSGKRKGRPPKKFAIEDGLTSGAESASPTKRKGGRPPKTVVTEESPPIPQPSAVVETEKTPVQDVSLPIVPPLPVASTNEDKVPKKISTTNLLRQQRKPKMAQPQPPVAESTPVSVAPTAAVVQQSNIPPPLVPIKKGRGRPPTKLLNFVTKQQEPELPGGLTLEQLRRRRHSQDDSMFTEELPALVPQRSKEFEDAQSKKKRGRPPKMRELSKHFVLTPLKPKTVNEAIAQAVSPINTLVLEERQYQKMGRPRKISFERPSRLSAAAEFLRTWTDRDESPTSQSTNNKTHVRRRRFSQDDSVLSENFVLEESRPSSRNRLRRYSQGDTLDDSSNEGPNSRKRLRSSGSDSSLSQDEKRPRVEKELCDQHSITKELLVKLTKIDKNEDQAPTAPEPIRELLKMSLRRKIEGNSSVDPPPLVPIAPHRLQPPTHSDAKLLMLMQPTEDKALMQQQAVAQQQPIAQPAQMQTQQFCIIFIPDSLTTNDPNLPKDAQPTATIVNFQPVPDAEMTNKSVIYTPTTPSKMYVTNDEHQNRSLLCQTCTQALDVIQRMQTNIGMTEEDKSAIKCPFCAENFQSTFHFEYHLRQEHLKCENERQCRHPGFNTLRIPTQDAAQESAIYITYALKCRSCYELFENVQKLNDHVKQKHANLIRHKPPVPQFSTPTGMVCYPPPPPFKNGARSDVRHCPSDCICRIGIRGTHSPQQRATLLQRCPNFMRRMEKIEAAAYEVYTCAVCKSTFLMKDEVVEHLMKMHEVACKFPCTKCLASFRTVQLQENHQCSEMTIGDLDKLINIVIMPTDKAHDSSKFEDSSNDELGPIKTTPPPAVPSASTPLNGVKRKNGVVIQKLSRYLTMHPPKKAKLDATSPTTGKRKKTPCPKCQKKFAYRKSLNDHIIFEHIIPCSADEASKNMAVELLRLVNNGSNDVLKIQELANALGKHTDDDGVSLRKLTMMDNEQENWNDQVDNDRDLLQCVNCKSCFKLPAANLSRWNNQHPIEAPGPALCDRCDPTKRRRNVVNNGHNSFNNLKSAISNGEPGSPQRVQFLFECDSCGDTFPTTIELNRHKTEEHTKTGEGLKCDICAKVFYSPRMLEKHKKMHHDDSMSNSRLEDDENLECNNQSVCNVSKDGSEANDTLNSSTSRRDSSDNVAKEEEKCKCPYCEYVAEKVSLKNHLKREHGVLAFICQFCGKLLVDISEVRHMLDYHIKSSNRKNNSNNSNGTSVITATSSATRDQDDVFDLLKTLGKKRLQSLMIYHDFEGKCNNAIMRCPICPEQFATRESCRHHYQWMHDSTCILCDTNYEGGNVAGKHKVAVHNSIASYVWAIQRLVSAIVHGLRLDRAQPSQALYNEVSMQFDRMIEEETNAMMMNVEGDLSVGRTSNNKTGNEETVPEPFLEPVVLSEDQLPGSGNMIEVVIGNDVMVEDSEDNLLENFYLSPNYESSCEQPKILDAGAPIPELEEEEEVVAAVTQIPLATACATLAIPTTPSLTTSNGGILIPTTPVTADTYATSAVFKLRQDNGQEEVVLAITDEDLVTYRDDIGSLAERLSATCDSLSLEEITTMLRSYFENVGIPQEVDLANATVEPRTQ